LVFISDPLEVVVSLVFLRINLLICGQISNIVARPIKRAKDILLQAFLKFILELRIFEARELLEVLSALQELLKVVDVVVSSVVAGILAFDVRNVRPGPVVEQELDGLRVLFLEGHNQRGLVLLIEVAVVQVSPFVQQESGDVEVAHLEQGPCKAGVAVVVDLVNLLGVSHKHPYGLRGIAGSCVVEWRQLGGRENVFTVRSVLGQVVDGGDVVLPNCIEHRRVVDQFPALHVGARSGLYQEVNALPLLRSNSQIEWTNALLVKSVHIRSRFHQQLQDLERPLVSGYPHRRDPVLLHLVQRKLFLNQILHCPRMPPFHCDVKGIRTVLVRYLHGHPVLK